MAAEQAEAKVPGNAGIRMVLRKSKIPKQKRGESSCRYMNIFVWTAEKPVKS